MRAQCCKPAIFIFYNILTHLHSPGWCLATHSQVKIGRDGKLKITGWERFWGIITAWERFATERFWSVLAKTCKWEVWFESLPRCLASPIPLKDIKHYVFGSIWIVPMPTTENSHLFVVPASHSQKPHSQWDETGQPYWHCKELVKPA